jgi:serine/threonine protein phosphatase 1
MMTRTIVVGDIHGALDHLDRLLAKLPDLDAGDTLVFLGDYIDRGPQSMEVVARVRALQAAGPARVIALRGNHEDAWLRVIDAGWEGFLFPPGNGCLATFRSYVGGPPPPRRAIATMEEFAAMSRGGFFPADVVAWMRALPTWYEDAHGIYVHAGLAERDGRWLHPREHTDHAPLLWTRTMRFFRDYRGPRVVVGHTRTETLPPELSYYTPEDPTDLWAGPCVTALDTGAGSDEGFLTALELPGLAVYESR